MTDRDESVATNALVSALGQLSLPDPVARSAWKAVSRLIGAVADIPAAAIERYVDRIRSGTKARETLTQAIAAAAGVSAAADPEIVKRAVNRWLPNELRKQDNKDNVARLAVQRLADMADEPDMKSAEIDDDWLNVFVGHAENASSDRMKELWSRVLAGEIRKPGRFSLRTLAFMAGLDASVASTFERYVPRVINDALFRETSGLEGQVYLDLALLAEAGLIHGIPSSAYQKVILGPQGLGIVVIGGGAFIEIHGEPNHVFRYDIYLLTKVGIELLQVVPRSVDPQLGKDWAARIDKANLRRIALRNPGQPEVILWQSPHS